MIGALGSGYWLIFDSFWGVRGWYQPRLYPGGEEYWLEQALGNFGRDFPEIAVSVAAEATGADSDFVFNQIHDYVVRRWYG